MAFNSFFVVRKKDRLRKWDEERRGALPKTGERELPWTEMRPNRSTERNLAIIVLTSQLVLYKWVCVGWVTVGVMASHVWLLLVARSHTYWLLLLSPPSAVQSCTHRHEAPDSRNRNNYQQLMDFFLSHSTPGGVSPSTDSFPPTIFHNQS